MNTTTTTVTSSMSGTNDPGHGWSNGDIAPQMFPITQEGRLQLYGSNRRWIGLHTNWTRIGHNTTEYDARHSSSAQGESTIETPEHEAQTVRALVSQLCENFYNHGWATGTGGGVSIRVGGPKESRPWRVFVAPSGIQKEDMIGNDIFELDMDRNVVVPPKTPNLRQSACTPLWYVVYNERPNATCVIHTHSIHAQMATLLDPTEQSKSLKITHLEMLKGVGNHAYDDVLEIPIIDNRPSEDLLANQLRQAVREYPKCNAVLVRRHGLYAWGDSWEQAKTQCESFDYLFQSAIQMKSIGIDCSLIPKVGTYREEETTTTTTTNGNDHDDALLNSAPGSSPPQKKLKTNNSNNDDNNNNNNNNATNGFNAAQDIENEIDLYSNTIPLLPRDDDAKILLLDIEGCTTSISFVHNVLFPYARQHLQEFINNNHMSSNDIKQLQMELLDDVKLWMTTQQQQQQEKKDETTTTTTTTSNNNNNNNNDNTMVVDEVPSQQDVKSLVTFLMDRDVKCASLKGLQGKIWKAGYESGTLQAHVYDDVPVALQWMKQNNIPTFIYSSGSVAAQKLLFGHTQAAGNLLPYVSGHFDITTAGSKKELSSYQKIAQTLQVPIHNIVFVSDLTSELQAASQAGMKYTIQSIRPGNAPIGSKYLFPTIHSLLQLCGK